MVHFHWKNLDIFLRENVPSHPRRQSRRGPQIFNQHALAWRFAHGTYYFVKMPLISLALAVLVTASLLNHSPKLHWVSGTSIADVLTVMALVRIEKRTACKAKKKKKNIYTIQCKWTVAQSHGMSWVDWIWLQCQMAQWGISNKSHRFKEAVTKMFVLFANQWETEGDQWLEKWFNDMLWSQFLQMQLKLWPLENSKNPWIHFEERGNLKCWNIKVLLGPRDLQSSITHKDIWLLHHLLSAPIISQSVATRNPYNWGFDPYAIMSPTNRANALQM